MAVRSSNTSEFHMCGDAMFIVTREKGKNNSGKDQMSMRPTGKGRAAIKATE